MVESRNIHEMGGDKTSSSLSLTSWMAKNLRFLPLLKSTWIPTWHPMDHVSSGRHSLVYFAYICDNDLLKWGLFTYEKGL